MRKSLTLFLLIIISSFFIYSNIEADIGDTSSENEEEVKNDLDIYFYPLGLKKSGSDGELSYNHATAEGDSCIIVVGDVEILVDGGSSITSNEAIKDNMRKHVSDDNIWDYIIVTHADEDHIAAFTTNDGKDGIFSLFTNAEMKLRTLIDFDITQDESVEYPNKDKLFTTNVYNIYKKCREKVLNNKQTDEEGNSIPNYYTASECCFKQRGVDQPNKEGISNVFSLNTNTTLQILYNYYYDHKYNPETQVSSLDRNLLSVCFTINVDNIGEVDRFLFTGDLQEKDSANSYRYVGGETELLNQNEELKEGVLFYKAAHHGSKTSSSEAFIDEIRPVYVVIPTIAGNNSHNHEFNSNESWPAIEVTDALFKYTDYIYIPTMTNGDKENKRILDYYGDIHLAYNDGEVNVETSNLMTEDGPTLIQNTDWFKKYRNATLQTYSFSGFESNENAYFGSCNLIKYGHIDILINCGFYNSTYDKKRDLYINKIKKYCVDGVLEYVIATSYQLQYIQHMVDSSRTKGIFSIFKIDNLIDFGAIPEPTEGANVSCFSKYIAARSKLRDTNYLPVTSVTDRNRKIILTDDFSFTILDNPNYGELIDNGIALIFEFHDNRLLFTGDVSSYGEKELINNNEKLFNNIIYYNVADFGSQSSSSEYLLNTITRYKTVENIYFIINSIWGKKIHNRNIMSNEFIKRLIDYNKTNTYINIDADLNSENGPYIEIYGDFRFDLSYKGGELNDSLHGIRINNTNELVNLINTNHYDDLFG